MVTFLSGHNLGHEERQVKVQVATLDNLKDLDGGLPVWDLSYQDEQVQVGYKQGKVSNNLMVAFLSGNLAIRMDRCRSDTRIVKCAVP